MLTKVQLTYSKVYFSSEISNQNVKACMKSN